MAFNIGDTVRVTKNVNKELPAGSTAEILNVHSGEFPYELLGSFNCFAQNELEPI